MFLTVGSNIVVLTITLLSQEFAYNFHFRSDGTDTLMDIGCGSGDVTIDFILPLLPLNFKRLVGSDLSDQMVRYAQESFQHPKIAFHKLDIGGDLTGYLETVEPFDHITSFYCLHWVQNQRKAMQNIFDLLQPGGDCLVAFLAANPIFEIYKQMSQMIRWSHFMADVNRYISPYQYSLNPIKEFEKTLLSVGFSDYQVSVRDKMFTFDGLDILKSKNERCYGAVAPKSKENFVQFVYFRISESCKSVLGSYTTRRTR